MRPIMLTMTALGPYAGEEVVDFREAVTSGLFGIYGSTGSGKSTIFSAMTFALFGEASRSDQDTSSLRSDYAASDILTQVDFIFEIGAKRYLVRRTPDQMRPALRGDGETKDVHKAWLFDVTDIDPDDITDDNCGKVIAEKKVGDVKAAVIERLGYGAEQFRQIVLLPQGKFETFLTAKTDERMKILRDLFDVSLYRKLAQTLKDQAKEAEDAVLIDRRTCASRLSHGGYESPDALKAGIAETKDEHTKAEVISSAAAEAAVIAVKKQADASQLEAAFLARDKAKTDLQELTDQATDMADAETSLNNARKAHSLLDVDQAQRTAKAILANAEAELGTAKTAHEAATVDTATASTQLKTQDGLAGKRDEQSRHVDELARHTTTLVEAKSLMMDWEATQSKAASDQTAHDQAETHLKQIVALHHEVQNQGKAAQSNKLERGKLSADLTGAEQALAATKAHTEAGRLWSEATLLATKTAAVQVDTSSCLGDAQIRYNRAEKALAAVQAQRLAEKLLDGEPCKVCGSTSHPAPAEGHAESAGRNQTFEEAKARLEEMRFADGSAVEKLSVAKARVEDRKANLDKLAQPEHILEAAQQIVDQLNGKLTALSPEANAAEIEASIAELAEQVMDAQSAASKSRTQLEASKTTAALAKQAYGNALGSIPGALRGESALATASQTAATVLETMLDALQSARDRGKQARDNDLSCAKDLENAEKTITNAKFARKLAEDTFAERLQQQGLSIDAFDTHKADIDQIDELTTQINAHKEALAIAHDRVKMRMEAIKDKARPDIHALNQASKMADAVRNDEAASAATLKATVDQLETLLKSISEELVRIDKVEQDTAALRELAALFNANNTAKIDLETFAIGAMFDQVLQAANLRLQPMTSGRYSLERELDGKGGGRRGLGICVHDIYTGKERATSTLSGGETFIAALSLALGLSDIVESISGNIRLDTIFIDEGFGSLDTDNDTGTLDQVLQTLQDLVGDNRAVGLISHVQQVQHAIPNGFTIKKTATGSHVEMRGF